jgi:hypothetical protein
MPLELMQEVLNKSICQQGLNLDELRMICLPVHVER